MNKNYPLVYIVVINYNGGEYLKKCINSLLNLSYPNYKILVVDNSSFSNDVEYLTKNFSGIEIIKNKKNIGFAAGCNIGIKYALKKGAEYIFLFNNDAVIDKDSLTILVKTCSKSKNIGIVGPKILLMDNPKIIQDIGLTCDILGFPIGYYSNEIDKGQYKQLSEVFFISGCAMLIKREVIEKIGLFDEKYFMFVEDLDFCWRARLVGYKILVNANATVYHKGGASMIGGILKKGYITNLYRIYHRERNTLRTLLKNYELPLLIFIIPLYLITLLLELLLFTFINPKVSFIYLKSLLWNITNIKDTLKERRKIQKIRVINDREILKYMKFRIAKFDVFRKVGIPKIIEK